MASNVRPVAATETGSRSTWRRALNVALVIAFVVASVAAQAVNLTPVAIVFLVAAICALAPLFAPSLEA